jgi:hypothetical protein
MMPANVSELVTIRRQTYSASADNGRGGGGTEATVYTSIPCGFYETSGNDAVIYGGDRYPEFGTARFEGPYAIQVGDIIRLSTNLDLEVSRVSKRTVGLGIVTRVDCEWRARQV